MRDWSCTSIRTFIFQTCCVFTTGCMKWMLRGPNEGSRRHLPTPTSRLHLWQTVDSGLLVVGLSQMPRDPGNGGGVHFFPLGVGVVE